MGGTALITATKYDIVCRVCGWGKGRGSVGMDVWV